MVPYFEETARELAAQGEWIFVFSVVEFLGDNLAFDLKVFYINGHYYAGEDSTCFLGDEGKSLILVKQPLHDLHILSKCIP